MPLVLTLKQDQDFYVGDERFIVLDVQEDCYRVERELTGHAYVVTDKRSVEVLPDVYLAAGDRPQAYVASIAIDAPRSLTILRGESYRKEKPPCST